MPWPAKPPMTLKEAKRARKKDVGFRYTASQLARADRLDAREEQRKKALEKEKQRAENKRKKEEKLEKERVVKQKMLEEGRITVEDTWGKVTASQPRLNKFFGQKPALPMKRRRLQDEPIAEEVIVSENLVSEKETGYAENLHQGEDLGNVASNNIAETKLFSVSHLLKSPSKQTLPSSLPSLRRILHQPGLIPDASSHVQQRPAHSQLSTLKELRPSQINTRSVRTQRHLSETETTLLQKPSVPIKLQPDTGGPGAAATFKDTSLLSCHSPRSNPPLSTIVTQKAPEFQDHENEIQTHQQEASEVADWQCQNSGGETHTTGLRMTGDEEDFTDGIDDETFLMLYATQKPMQETCRTGQENAAKQRPQVLTPQTHGFASSEKSAYSSSKEQTCEVNLLAEKAASEAKSLTTSDSFSSVFNEIEDEDLIALAEEIEAGMASAPKPKITAPNSPPKQERKGRRRLPWELPWDDFDAPGPSTQALMLELVEEAEAGVHR
ncbi:uncharacterized protein Z518_09953 [Rhinocladiella mackenziei CBS 650.93]|uniref:Uncharacterized protein n=1 Tax=Rhinocladiella mackenziei CBS 650.93 TaxID=1442369 RepID=A0A0D2GRE4_9EURO|nr:uncharacterized protein Z518_09953 [Rhinocladiella mackenziei CBS 650.93]KIX00888.1 hypothetical protein Z518_09953 [Rhinocladiella mackenziei CBS 650.93]